MATAPSHVESVRQSLFVEPLGGPIGPDSLLESFPDSLYDKSPSSHFYRFMYALLGPSGVGGLVRNYFEARLKFLEYGIEYFDIERFYGNPFAFGRILEEQTVDVDESLLPEGWEKIKAQDASYRSRSLDFLAAARLGGTPQGIRMAAKSGLGHDVGVYERYKWIFDNYSDMPIGVKNWGHTDSINEFTVVPRREVGISEIQRIKFEATAASGQYILTFRGHATRALGISDDATAVQSALRALPVIGPNGVIVTGGPMSLPFDVKFTGDLAYEDISAIEISSTLKDASVPTPKPVNTEVDTLREGVSPLDEAYRIPDRLAHNMQNAIDRFRPVNSIPTINKAKGTTISREWRTVDSSSTYREVIRFVTGRLDVNWPNRSATENFWIEAEVEKPGLKTARNDSGHYIHFHKPFDVESYYEEPIDDPGDPGNFIEVRTGYNFSDHDHAPSYAVESNPDPRTLVDEMVQGIYPTQYSELGNIEPMADSSMYWESLAQNSPTTEIIEVDLGADQVINFVSLDIGSRPVNVVIEYDGGVGSSHFLPITSTKSGFTGYIDEADGWSHLDTSFTDSRGQLIIARRIRVKLYRRVPLQGDVPYSVLVRGLKVGRKAI